MHSWNGPRMMLKLLDETKIALVNQQLSALLRPWRVLGMGTAALEPSLTQQFSRHS